ncbi:MAG: hypothetical protein M0P31_09885 [Solirubrobacteraceae bacterium]|nr:hypothetical protein [Solirubrobacteraceae bacterium]
MPRTVNRTLTALAVAAAATAVMPATGATAMTKGLQDDLMIYSDDPALRQAFWDDARSAKVKVVRTLVRFDTNHDEIDPVTLARLRRAADEGRAAGAKLLIGPYVTIGKDHKRSVPSKIQTRFVKFMRSVATGMADKPVYGYLTFNEPNYRIAWPQGTSAARSWVRLSNRVHDTIKRSDRGAKVFVGETSPNVRNQAGSKNPGSFFRTALCLNKNFKPTSRSKRCRTKLKGDGVTIHTYDFTRSPTRSVRNEDWWTHGNLKTTVRQIRSLARAKRLTTKASRNIHISEFAYRTQGSFKTPTSRAARYLKQAWSFAKKQKIKSFTWYQLRDPDNADKWRSGLQTNSGKSRKTWTTFRKLR